MRFFHNAKTETVYALEDIRVSKVGLDADQQDKHEQAASNGWDVAVHIKITRADNWFDPAAWEWRHPVSLHVHERYPSSQSEKSVRADFTEHKIPFHLFGQEIPVEEYTELQRQYELRATGGLVEGSPED